MPVSLVRIDDRLVHGQVVEGWVRSLRITHIVVASDTVAADETQKALYLLAVPQNVSLDCLRVEECVNAWKSARWDGEKTLILVATPEDALRLSDLGAPLTTINVGGIHFREGRTQILKAVSVDERDVKAFQSLLARGVTLEARPLPLDDPIDLKSYLERWKSEREAIGEQPR